MLGGKRFSLRFPMRFAALAPLLLLSGCWDRIEINDVAFVMVSSNDFDKDGYYVGSTKIAVPSGMGGYSGKGGGGGQSQSFIIEEARGRDINEVIQNLQRKLPRRLNISHRRVLYIGERLARQGIGPILDHYSRNPTSRHIAYVLIAKGRKGSELLKLSNPLERIPGEEIRELERLTTGEIYSLRDYLIAASGTGRVPVLGVVELTRSVGREEVAIGGSAILVNDKLKGYLSADETKVMQLLQNKLKYMRISAPVPDEKGSVSMQVIKAKSAIKPFVEGDRVTIRVKLKVSGEVLENTTKLDLKKPQLLEKAQKVLQTQLQQRVQEAVEHVQEEYRADVFGFGDAIFRTRPKAWKRLEPQWEKIFSGANIIVRAEVTIRNAGMSGKPLHLKEKGESKK